MTPLEDRGFLRGAAFLLLLAGLRLGVEAVLPEPSPLPEGPDDLPALLEESRELRSLEAERRRPLAPGERIDPNRAEALELDRLPGVGPATARAIVEERESSGGFRAPEDLLRIRGIGPATLERIRPYLDLSGGVPPELRRRQLPPHRVRINQAGREELERLPGVGPALAGRILESRERDGPFRVPEDLLRVRGIGPATLERLRPLLELGG